MFKLKPWTKLDLPKKTSTKDLIEKQEKQGVKDYYYFRLVFVVIMLRKFLYLFICKKNRTSSSRVSNRLFIIFIFRFRLFLGINNNLSLSLRLYVSVQFY